MTDHRLRNIIDFYHQGFRAMRLGRTLWSLLLVKLLVLAVLSWIFLPNQLNTTFANDRQRAAHVLEQLTVAKSHP